MSAIVMRLVGAPSGPTGWDGCFLVGFDFEAAGGIGEIEMASDIADARRFADMAEAIAFYRQSPQCRPLRPDGKPNRPLTATHWEFRLVD